nr:unnamed protein product [Digitaria exilis]
MELHLALASAARVGCVGELEVQRRAAAHRRRAVVAAHAHVAAVAEHPALVLHRRPLRRRGVAAARHAVGAEVSVGVEAHEPQHVDGLAIVAAVRHHGLWCQLAAGGQTHEAVGLYVPLLVHLRVRLPVCLSTVKTYGAEVRFMPAVKFWDTTTVSVGWSNDCHKVVPVEFLSTRLPFSRTAAAATPWPPVLEDQSTAPDPLRRRRSPLDVRRSEPPESTAAPAPADQTGTPPA